jgi:MATE family multidrug resistance protein
MIESTADVGKYTRIYFDIRIYTAPAVLALYGINGWFLGMQNAAYPMIVTITHNLLNIVLNVLFIYGLGMHVDGVAYGTLISTYLALLLAFVLYFKKYRNYVPHFAWNALLNPGRLKEYFTVNRDIFIRTLCLIFTFSFFTAVSSTQGEIILAANTILLQYWFIVSYGIDGFAYAAESLVGRFKGSGNIKKLKKSVVYTTSWGLLIGLTGTLIYGLFGNNLLTLFTNKTAVISHAETVLVWTILAPVVSAFCYILDGVFIGATETAPMRNTMLISTFAVFLPAYYLLTDIFGVHGLWLAMLLFMLSRGVALGFYLPGTVLNKAAT